MAVRKETFFLKGCSLLFDAVCSSLVFASGSFKVYESGNFFCSSWVGCLLLGA